MSLKFRPGLFLSPIGFAHTSHCCLFPLLQSLSSHSLNVYSSRLKVASACLLFLLLDVIQCQIPELPGKYGSLLGCLKELSWNPVFNDTFQKLLLLSPKSLIHHQILFEEKGGLELGWAKRWMGCCLNLFFLPVISQVLP